MNARTYRSSVRWIHLGLSGVLGTWIYSPWSGNPIFDASIKWLVFPFLGLTGFALWQQGRVLRFLGGNSRSTRGVAIEAKS